MKNKERLGNNKKSKLKKLKQIIKKNEEKINHLFNSKFKMDTEMDTCINRIDKLERKSINIKIVGLMPILLVAIIIGYSVQVMSLISQVESNQVKLDYLKHIKKNNDINKMYLQMGLQKENIERAFTNQKKAVKTTVEDSTLLAKKNDNKTAVKEKKSWLEQLK